MIPDVLVFLNTEIVLEFIFAIARSGFPSPSKLPMETLAGHEPVVKSTCDAKETVPDVLVFLNTETVLPMFATARSGLPSPSKSPIETFTGYVPVVKSIFVAKEMVPDVLVFLNTETVLEFPTMTRSGLPSPSKSPIETLSGVEPVVKSTFVAKETVSDLLVFLNIETVLEL